MTRHARERPLRRRTHGAHPLPHTGARYAGRTPRDPDDHALAWDGDDDPTLDVGSSDPGVAATSTPVSADPAPLVLPEGFAAVGRGSDAVGRPADANAAEAVAAEAEASAPLGNALLVTLGVIAGAFLLYTVGWVIGGLRLAGTAEFLVSPVGYRFALWLAVAAPALWFVATLVLTRRSKTWLRIVWLVAGLVLLVPWPLLTTGPV